MGVRGTHCENVEGVLQRKVPGVQEVESGGGFEGGVVEGELVEEVVEIGGRGVGEEDGGGEEDCGVPGGGVGREEDVVVVKFEVGGENPMVVEKVGVFEGRVAIVEDIVFAMGLENNVAGEDVAV